MNLISFALLRAMARGSVFDGEGGDDPQNQDAFKDFSPEQQAKINSFLAEERRKNQATSQKALDELNALRQKAQLTDKERKELDQRVEALQNELLTKEQIAARDKEKMKKDHDNIVNTLTAERDHYQSIYTNYRIKESITSAAASNDAYNPEQLVAILTPQTRLVEALDDEGKPTGDYVPKVKFNDVGKDGKPITLELAPADAVKRMSEMDAYMNLFKNKGASGLGMNNNSKAGQPNLTALLKNPAEYREARKKGLI